MASGFAWRQACPSCVLLTHVGPEAFPVVENLLIEVSPVLSPGTAHWILLKAIDDRLRNGRPVCRHVRGKVGIRQVEEQEIYEVDSGGYRWCVNFIGDLVTPGSFWDGKQIGLHVGVGCAASVPAERKTAIASVTGKIATVRVCMTFSISRLTMYQTRLPRSRSRRVRETDSLPAACGRLACWRARPRDRELSVSHFGRKGYGRNQSRAQFANPLD